MAETRCGLIPSVRERRDIAVEAVAGGLLDVLLAGHEWPQTCW
jgi:hypothetical protein